MTTAISMNSGVRTPAPADSTPAALGPTSWAPRTELVIADWLEQGRWLGAVGRASSWWIGDWVRYGTARYGDRYAKAAQLTGYDVQSLMNMAYVAGRFSVSRRRERLSFSHHAELAALPQDDQELWLDRAEAGLLSVRTLRAELRAVRSKVAGRPAHELVCPECGHRFGAAPPVSEAL